MATPGLGPALGSYAGPQAALSVGHLLKVTPGCLAPGALAQATVASLACTLTEHSDASHTGRLLTCGCCWEVTEELCPGRKVKHWPLLSG